MKVQLSKSAVRLRISIGQAEGLLKSPISQMFRISATFSIHVVIQSVMHFGFDDQPDVLIPPTMLPKKPQEL